MSLIDAMKFRENIRFFKQDEYPTEVEIKALIRDTHELVPQKNKHTIVETKPWEEYTIGILPGHRGGKIILTKETYPTRGKAEHAIFLKRLKDLLSFYGIDS